MKKVLAVASFGGHWVQLQRLETLFKEFDTYLVSTNSSANHSGYENKFFPIRDFSLDTKLRIPYAFLQAITILLKIRPDIVITTGAAPGLLFLALGKMMRCKTIWIDSVANGEKMSLSGKLARPFADLWASQWEDVAIRSGSRFIGRVI